MAIFEGKDYLIHSHFYGEQSPDEDPGIYVGDIRSLQKTIATTWGKTPHTVKVYMNNVQVVTVDGMTLAVFTFTELTSKQLPDHF